jgi:hypothetical protein
MQNPGPKEQQMRVMVIVKANEDSEAGTPPDTRMLEEMGKYNEELVKAGVMLVGEGLQPSSKGVRIQFSGDQRTVVDGPFAETKELVAGFWLIQAKSKEEAIEWAKRCPATDNEVIEVRQVQEMSDYTPEVQQAAASLTELQDKAGQRREA